MSRVRLGVALLLPSPVAEEVDGMRRALADRSLGRVPPHLTLVPPVNVAEADLGRALALLRLAAGGTPGPLAVALGPPTSFLPTNPVVYLPVEGGADGVQALRDRVWQGPLMRRLTWPFVAHVTLADDTSPGRIDAAVAALSAYRAEVVFEGLHLLIERRPGPVWVPLADVSLGPPAVVARGGPLAVELVGSRMIDPEGAAMLGREGVSAAVGQRPLGGPPGRRLAGGPLVVTARREGGVVGVGAAWLGFDGVQRAVYVAEAHRRQGIGRHLDAALSGAIAEAAWFGERRPDEGSG